MSKWIVVSGHGVWVPGEEFVVPAGITVKFFCSHGIYIKVNQSGIDENAVEGKKPSEALVKETLNPGEICHEYMLSYPRGVNPIGKGAKKTGNLYKVQKNKDILLSDILNNKKINQCDVVYIYACRSAPKGNYLGDISRKGVQKMKREFANNAAKKDLELFMTDRLKWALTHLDAKI